MSDHHLLSEMDGIADALRANDPTLRDSLSDELQLEFRQLQKRRMPHLSKDEFLDLFHTWRLHYVAKLEAELAEQRKRIAANDCELRQLIAEQRRRNDKSSRDDAFICKCGAVIADPLDPGQMRIHQPHFVAASLERVHEGMLRWRAHHTRGQRND